MDSKKIHYKMYKRGKLWIVAGVTVVTFGYYEQLNAQAATPATAHVTETTAQIVEDGALVTTSTETSGADDRQQLAATTPAHDLPVNETGSESAKQLGSATDEQVSTGASQAASADQLSEQPAASTASQSTAAKPEQPAKSKPERPTTTDPAESLAPHAESQSVPDKVPAAVTAPDKATPDTERPGSETPLSDQMPATSAEHSDPQSAQDPVEADDQTAPATSETDTTSLETATPADDLNLSETASSSLEVTPVVNERAREIVAEEEDINVWMPDKNMQFVTFYNLKEAGYNITEPSQITKQMMAEMEDFFFNTDYQRRSKEYLDACLAIESLEGLQYANKIDRFSMTISLDALLDSGYTLKNLRSKLWDISALKGMNQLTEFTLQFTSVTDVSLIKDMSKLWLFSIAGNFITDVSSVPDVIKNAETPSPIGNQVVYMPGVYLHVDPVTGKYVTTSYIVDLDGKRVGVKPGEKSTAHGKNLDDFTIEWDNLGTGGMLVMEWDTPGLQGSVTGYPFNGKIVVPYRVDDAFGNAQINFVDENGTPVAQQLNVSDKLGNTQDLEQNAQVQAVLKQLKAKGLSVKTVQGTVNWTASDTLNSVTFIMETTKNKVTVTGQDEDGQAIPDFPVLDQKGETGADWTVTIPTLPGYEFVSAEQDGTAVEVQDGQLGGKFGNQDAQLTLNYKKKVGKVVINYVDTEQNPIAPSETNEGKFGESYEVSPKEVPGYHLVKVDGATTGQFGDGEVALTFIYEKDEELSAPGTDGGDENEGNQPGNNGGDANEGNQSGNNGGDENEGSQSGNNGGDENEGQQSGNNGGNENEGQQSGNNGGDENEGQQSGNNGGDENEGQQSGNQGGDANEGNQSDVQAGPDQSAEDDDQLSQGGPVTNGHDQKPGHGEAPNTNSQQPGPNQPDGANNQPAPAPTKPDQPALRPETQPATKPGVSPIQPSEPHRDPAQSPAQPAQSNVSPVTKPSQPAATAAQLPQTGERSDYWFHRIGLILASLTAGMILVRKKH